MIGRCDLVSRCVGSDKPRVQMGRAVLLLVSAVLALQCSLVPVCGDIVAIKELEFNVDGELPSAQSDIVFYSTGLPETAAYGLC